VDTTTGFPDVRFEEDPVATVDEGAQLVLVTEWTIRGAHEGPFEGLPPTGNGIELDGLEVITVSDDGITSITGYFDGTELADQLGLTFPAIVGQLPTLAVGAVEQRLR